METVNQPPHQKVSLRLDLRWLVLLLLAVIGVMLWLWQPWSGNTAGSRTVEVSGEAVIKATPDEFIFTPYYQFKGSSKDKVLAQLTKRSDQIIARLKKLGVADSQIKADSDSSDSLVYRPETNGQNTYTLRLTITANSKVLAQKVENYLLSTDPKGTLTPMANFSDAKRQQLENQARDQATKDARTKAEQSADNLGFKLGGVKSVSDNTGFGVLPFYKDLVAQGSVAPGAEGSQKPSLTIQPGENELRYSVTVVFFVK